MIFAKLVDHEIQTALKKIVLDIEPSRVTELHENLMHTVEAEPQDEPMPNYNAPYRPVDVQPPIPIYRAVALGIAMLLLGLFVGQGKQTLSVNVTDGEQKPSLMAMASPWGELIAEGD